MAFATPTGKAAQVLKSMGNENVYTIHKLLYTWYPRPNGQFAKKRNFYLEYKIIICDEVSMIETEMIQELLTHKECHIIFVGDPFQLEPVNKETKNDLLDNPHIFLTQIMRQALESDIVRLSLDVREGRPLEKFIGKDCQILKKEDVVDGMFTWADQIICGINTTRISINNKIKKLLGYKEDEIAEGQKIICLKNYWNKISEEGQPLVNGTIGYIQNVQRKTYNLPYRFGIPKIEIIKCNLVTENDDIYYDLFLDPNQLLTGERTIKNNDLEYKIKKYYDNRLSVGENPIPIEAEFGWAITCHKGQGSTFNNVLVFEEKFPREKEEHQKWVYTSMTRPSNKLVFIQK